MGMDLESENVPIVQEYVKTSSFEYEMPECEKKHAENLKYAPTRKLPSNRIASVHDAADFSQRTETSRIPEEKPAIVPQRKVEIRSEYIPAKKPFLATAKPIFRAEPVALKSEELRIMREIPNNSAKPQIVARMDRKGAEELQRIKADARRRAMIFDELQKRKITRQLAQAQFKEDVIEKDSLDLDEVLVGDEDLLFPEPENIEDSKESEYFEYKPNFSFKNLFELDFVLKKSALSFAFISLVVLCLVGSVVFVKKGMGVKGRVLGVSDEAFSNLTSAMGNVAKQDFDSSGKEFAMAHDKFSQASEDIDELGSVLVETSRFIPYASKLSSGKYAAEGAKHLSKAGEELSVVIKKLSLIKNPTSSDRQEGSFLELLDVLQNKGAVVRDELLSAQEDLQKVNIDDLPGDKREEFSKLKEKLPLLTDALDVFVNNSHIMADLFGANGPRKYLFLFQNNNEMRPTGGFIGSYGLLDISNGRINNFFIDGIFNPDGQLVEKIVPPKPIQKMSAAWSLHDSNWFADFPVSAHEAIKFYEKTGGPTVDGVITFTPTVMQKLLEITGPIDMPEYDVTLDAENFIEKTQYEVEVDYDKQENKPKKILGDLAPIVLDKLMSARDVKTVSRVAQTFSEALSQKHILLHSENEQLQDMISKQGWSGEVLESSRDYISVINTNINGYKTDGVVKESIQHSAEIQSDGSIIDTVVITRKHLGGDSDFDWWNKVNSDYMRVYVPKGSTLLEVSGQTREFTDPPLDYDALKFKRDPLVEEEESSMSIDETTGTRTYEQFGKTVFANWAYVSPKETVMVTYKYKLPFKLFQINSSSGARYDAYSLIAQKQSGSLGSKFVSRVSFPDNYELKWNTPGDLKQENKTIYGDKFLDIDRYSGFVFEKK